MGQKVNPVGIRLGIVKDWASRWYASIKRIFRHIMCRYQSKRISYVKNWPKLVLAEFKSIVQRVMQE